MSNLVTTMVESPYAADTPEGVSENMTYLARCLMDSLQRNEAPFASHGFYTMLLDDNVPEQRAMGMRAGIAWSVAAQRVAFYVDRGISPGMLGMLEDLVARYSTQHVTFRSLDHDAAWMRSVITGLPDYIQQHLDGVRVF